MKEFSSRQKYMKELKRRLRFQYNRDEADNILRDYHEFFEIESAQGRTEQEICILLGAPAVVVQNLKQEMHSPDSKRKSFFFRTMLLPAVFIVMIFLVAGGLLYQLNHDHGAPPLLAELLISLPLLSLLFWLTLKKLYPTAVTSGSHGFSLSALIAHLICFSIVVFLFFLFHPESIGFGGERLGLYVTGFFSLLSLFLLGMLLFCFFQFPKNPTACYPVICHILGVLAILLYNMSLLHIMEGPDLFSFQNINGGFLYLETLLLLFVFSILNKFSSKGTIKSWTHN